MPRDAFVLKIQRELSPEIRPKSFGTFEKQAPNVSRGTFFPHQVIAFKRMHTNYVVFHSRVFYDVPRVLIAYAMSFQALAAILGYVSPTLDVMLVSVPCQTR